MLGESMNSLLPEMGISHLQAMLSLRNQILKGRYIVRLSFEEKASFG
jgi:hypothetical protein